MNKQPVRRSNSYTHICARYSLRHLLCSRPDAPLVPALF